jgi:hypothetical protein
MKALDAAFLEKVFSDGEMSAVECPMPAGAFPKETPLAMAYVPFQSWEKPYDTATALARGTIFPSLDKPFIGEEAVGNGK